MLPYSVWSYLQSELSGKYYNHFNQMSPDLSSGDPYNNGNMFNITTYKFSEWYRFGVQFQYKNGEWSDVVFVGDKQNTLKVKSGYDVAFRFQTPELTKAVLSIDTTGLSSDYKKVRPVVVYPSVLERQIVCQGILCPTIFNVGDRVNNRTYSYSSWFSRPNAPKQL